tara:strand:- start:340 stop:900 length:561 start_codon:yes stop_codon:yes gene_type:complete
MYNFKDDKYPEWADENADWAFNRNTVTQLGQIARQLSEAKFEVESGIDMNAKVSDDMPIKDYQNAIDGLVLVADSKPDSNGYTKKVVIKTDVNDESILVQAGFDGSKTRLWNNGIIYDELFTKDELGKFSAVWDKINTNFLKNETIIPIVEQDELQNQIEKALDSFIESGLKSGYVKKLRVKKNEL